MPWHLRTDLQRFKKITSNHAIIMGRKTLESIGRPLPNRLNIVLSRTAGFDQHQSLWGKDCNLIWAKDRESALFFADVYTMLHGQDEFFVIGGAEIYKAFHDLFNKIHLTEVLADNIEGDAHFNYSFEAKEWKATQEDELPASENDDYPTRYIVFERKVKRDRRRWSEEFLTDSSEMIEFLKSHQALPANSCGVREEESAQGVLSELLTGT